MNEDEIKNLLHDLANKITLVDAVIREFKNIENESLNPQIEKLSNINDGFKVLLNSSRNKSF